MKTTLGEGVELWLRQSVGKCFCDECISNGVGIDLSRACNFTKRLGAKSYSSKYRGKCDLCSGVKLVTILNRNAV